MQLDHIELFVPERWAAARWYGQVFGHVVVDQHVDWAEAGGPLMITNDGGVTMLALFDGPPQADAEVRGLRRVAFRVSAAAFVDFIKSSGEWRTPALSAENVQDHEKSWSVYFTDPYGNPLEVTTYEYAAAKAKLAAWM